MITHGSVDAPLVFFGQDGHRIADLSRATDLPADIVDQRAIRPSARHAHRGKQS
jgi:hypothetical protein